MPFSKFKKPAALRPPVLKKRRHLKNNEPGDDLLLKAVESIKTQNRECGRADISCKGNIAAKGSITIYLMLSLVIILVLILTLTESARVSAVSARLRSVTYMAADSVFSEYARPVFDDYGIMVLWKSEDEFINEFSEYAGFNLDSSDLSYKASADFYGMDFTGMTLGEITYITDNGGLVFAGQVYEYMDYYLTQSAAQALLDGLDIFSQADTVSTFTEKLESYADVFTDVTEKVWEVKEAAQAAQDILSDPGKLLDELYEYASGYPEDTSAGNGFSKTLKKLKSSLSDLESSLEEITQAADEYYESVQSAQKAVSSLEDSLAEAADELSGDVYESLESQINELKENSTDTGEDYYGISAAKEAAAEYLEILEGLDEELSEAGSTLTEENAAEYVKIIESYKDLFSDFDAEALDVNIDAESADYADTSILDYISGLINNGVLAYVKDDISEKSVSADSLPSQTCAAAQTASADTDALDIVIFGEYVLTGFGNACDAEEDTALDYEAEYIIGGKSSDLENLKVVVNKLVTLRTGLNYISILTDSEKRSEAYTLAAAMTGAVPVLTSAFQMLILAAWSAAEAVADVKALLEGEKVPAVKTSDQWSLSIDGFKNFTGKDLETVSCDSGLEYKEYLRILLAAEDEQDLYYRTMDIIQADICLNENEEFLMSECITGVEICACYSANELFTSFGFVSSALEASDGVYSFSVTQLYEY